MASFTQHTLEMLLSLMVVLKGCSLPLLSSTPLYEHTTMILFFYPLKNIQVACSF